MIRRVTASGLETAAFEVLESEVLEFFEVLELGMLFQENPEAKFQKVVESDVVELETVETACEVLE